MQSCRLASLRRREPGDRQPRARGEHTAEFAERADRVKRELQGVDCERRIEALIGERQLVDPALGERRLADALMRDREQRGRDVDPAHVCPTGGRALEREARAAADVEQPRPPADLSAIERCVHQPEVLRLGEHRPVLRALAPQTALGRLPAFAVRQVGHGSSHRRNSIQKVDLCTVT
jgi:hypothetical protein